MSWLLKFSLTLLPFILAVGVIVYGDSLPTYTKNNDLVPESIIPSGWYPHALGTSSVIFTRSRFLPHIEGTEGYAYGEQIGVGVMPYDGNPTNPEDWYYLEWTKDEVMVQSAVWSTLGDYKILKIVGEAGGAGGGQITYFIFIKDTVHTVSLYPYQNSVHLSTFETLVLEYTKSLPHK